MRKKEEKPRKAYKFRIYPTKEQKILFAKTFGCARFIYNQMLSNINEKKPLRTPAQEYYVSILVEYENQVLKTTPKTFVGLDYSMHELYVSSDGEKAKYPQFYRKAEKKLARMQRWLSRKVKGSHNRDKWRRRLSKQHGHVANQRLDFLHKDTFRLVNTYDCICVEDFFED